MNSKDTKCGRLTSIRLMRHPNAKHAVTMKDAEKLLLSNAVDVNLLRSLLDYNPETGILRWKENRGGTAKAGDIAGCVMRNGYRKITVKCIPLLSHRAAWAMTYGEWPSFQIDHINGVRADNRICNLRQSTHTENARNHGNSRRNKSGKVGVFWLEDCRKWWAYIHYNGKNINLGRFAEYADAVAAREKAEREYYRDFARAC